MNQAPQHWNSLNAVAQCIGSKPTFKVMALPHELNKIGSNLLHKSYHIRIKKFHTNLRIPRRCVEKSPMCGWMSFQSNTQHIMSWVELEDEFVTLWVVAVVQEIYSSASSLKGSFVERGKKGSKVVMQLKNPMKPRTANTK